MTHAGTPDPIADFFRGLEEAELNEHDLKLLSHVHYLHLQGIRKVDTYALYRWGPEDIDMYGSICSCIQHGYLAEYRRVFVMLTPLGDYLRRLARAPAAPAVGR